MTNIFIAPKIKVGFQKRGGTFTGKLAYIIYFDEKGNLRKEKSWESWRDKKIDSQEFENIPTDGFTINKDIKRYSGEWFSSKRTMIRVHDPRGFEFEVTTENLIGILMHTDCLRRGLIGQFVYAWMGQELVLLPVTSEEYQKAVKYTKGLSKKVGTKDLVAGISYRTKREGDVIYMGRLNCFKYGNGGRYSDHTGLRNEEKVHIFTSDEGKTFFKKTGADFISEPNSDQPVSNFAELMDNFNNKVYANKIVKYDFRPVTFDETTETRYSQLHLKRNTYFVPVGENSNIFFEKRVNLEQEWKNNEYQTKGYSIYTDYYSRESINQIDGSIDKREDLAQLNSYRYSYYKNSLSLEEMKKQKFYDLFVIFENGKELKINNLYELTQYC